MSQEDGVLDTKVKIKNEIEAKSKLLSFYVKTDEGRWCDPKPLLCLALDMVDDGLLKAVEIRDFPLLSCNDCHLDEHEGITMTHEILTFIENTGTYTDNVIDSVLIQGHEPDYYDEPIQFRDAELELWKAWIDRILRRYPTAELFEFRASQFNLEIDADDLWDETKRANITHKLEKYSKWTK